MSKFLIPLSILPAVALFSMQRYYQVCDAGSGSIHSQTTQNLYEAQNEKLGITVLSEGNDADALSGLLKNILNSEYM